MITPKAFVFFFDEDIFSKSEMGIPSCDSKYNMSHLSNPKNRRSRCDGSSNRSLMAHPFSYFLFPPVFYESCNKDRGMCHPVCVMVHIKEP